MVDKGLLRAMAGILPLNWRFVGGLGLASGLCPGVLQLFLLMMSGLFGLVNRLLRCLVMFMAMFNLMLVSRPFVMYPNIHFFLSHELLLWS